MCALVTCDSRDSCAVCVCAVSSCEVRGERVDRGVLVGRDRDAGVRGEREMQEAQCV